MGDRVWNLFMGRERGYSQNVGVLIVLVGCYLSHQSHPLICIILKLNFIPNPSYGKKLCMLNLAIFFPCWALHLTVVYTLDHGRLVDHISSNNRTYNLLFSCASLKCNKEGNSLVFKLVHIPLVFLSLYFLYCSYIYVPEIPIFLYIWSL